MVMRALLSVGLFTFFTGVSGARHVLVALASDGKKRRSHILLKDRDTQAQGGWIQNFKGRR